MKKCWDKDPFKRPNASEIKKIIDDWISIISDKNIDKESNIIMEFYKADTNILNTSDVVSNKSHPQAYHTSRLLDFTTKLNEVLYQEEIEIYGYDNNKDETEISQSIGNYYKIY